MKSNYSRFYKRGEIYLTTIKGKYFSIKNSLTSPKENKMILINQMNNNSKNKYNIYKISSKNHFDYNRKSLKWYWREKTYDMFEGDVYKEYEIKFKYKQHIELIPQNYENSKRYDSCLIWLYDGDFPEYFIEHLLEFNNFPPKVSRMLDFLFLIFKL
jgi:tRNA U34 5-carboxymethylaminomethyl modifying enzyme MnmG/GidA